MGDQAVSAKLLKMESQLIATVQERDNLLKEVAKARDLNKRGDAAYTTLQADMRKLNDALSKTKDAKAIRNLTEERDTYEAQLQGMQGILRSNMQELEKYKKIAEQAGNQQAGASSANNTQQELQSRIDQLRAEVKSLVTRLAELESTAAVAIADANNGEGGTSEIDAEQLSKRAEADAEVEDCRAKLQASRDALAAAEEETADSASAAVKATRAREKIEREQKEKLSILESALEAKVKEAVELAAARDAVEEAHSRDLENILMKMQEKDLELSTLRARSKEAADTQNDAAAQLSEALKQRDEAVKKRDADAKNRDEVVARATKDKEDDYRKVLKEKDDELKKSLKEKDEELKKALKEKDEDMKKALKEKEEELKKLAAAAKEAAAGKEAAVMQADMQRKVDAAQNAVRQLTESTADLSREKEEAVADARSLRDKLIKRENKLTIVTQERADAGAQVAELSNEVKSLSKKLEKARTANKVVETNLKESKSEADKLSEGARKAAELKTKLEAELASTKAALLEVQEMCTRALADLDAANTELELRGDAMGRLEEAVAAAQSRVEELRAEHAVATRLVKQVNKELKAQLSSESRRCTKLERELGQAQKAMLNAAKAGVAVGVLPPNSPAISGYSASAASPARPPAALQLPGSAGAGTPSTVPSSASANPFDSNPFGVPTGSPAPRATPVVPKAVAAFRAAGAVGSAKRASHEGVAAMGGGDMAETVKLLGSRLREVLGEAEVAKEKVRMLEGIVQALTGELDEKKRLLKELTSSSGASAHEGKAEADIDAEAAASAVVSGSPEAAVPLLQSRLAKALAEAARLRRDIKTIGGEVLEAQDRAREAERSAAQAHALLRETQSGRPLVPVDDLGAGNPFGADPGSITDVNEDSRGSRAGSEQ